MATNFKEVYGNLSGILNATYKDIEATDVGDAGPLKNRILTNLKREIDSLNTRSGIADFVAPVNVRTKPQPLKSMFGTDLTRSRKRNEKRPSQATNKAEFIKAVNETARDQEGGRLKVAVDRALPNFITMTNDEIRDKFSDMEILGVAKKADLPVTEETKVDSKFISQVKDAIRKKNLEKK